MRRISMAKTLRGLFGRVADKLLPQTIAAAGCAPDCFYVYNDYGPVGKCCYGADCKVHC
jgi:hypothetical protein